MSEIATTDGHFYSEETKLKFVEDYFRTGKLTVSAKNLEVNYETAKYWKRQEWFDKALTKLRAEHDRQMDRRLTSVIDRAIEAIEDRIEHGEERITKSGEIVVLKPGLAALTIAMGTAVDKRNIIRTGGTTTTEGDILEKLAETLRKFARPQVIDATDVDYKDNP